MGLFSKVIDQQKLTEAWNRVKRNKPAPGVDEMTWEDFDGNRKQNIRQLNIGLSEHKYESLPVKLVPLYKGERSGKSACIPCVIKSSSSRSHRSWSACTTD